MTTVYCGFQDGKFSSSDRDSSECPIISCIAYVPRCIIHCIGRYHDFVAAASAIARSGVIAHKRVERAAVQLSEYE